jgi:hypothetical protein
MDAAAFRAPEDLHASRAFMHNPLNLNASKNSACLGLDLKMLGSPGNP